MKARLVQGALAIALCLAIPTSAFAAEAESTIPVESECDSHKVREVDRYRAHPATVSEPIDLVPRQIKPLSFGTHRGTMGAFVTLQASSQIPTDIYSTDFEIDTVEPMSRVGNGSLESTHLDQPTFSPPHIFNHRKEVGFYFCVNTADDAKAGAYTGQFNLVGPEGISTASLTPTAQLKARTWEFLVVLVVVLAIAATILVANIIFIPDKKVSRGSRIFAGVVTFVAAVLAILVAWSQNPTWGENIWVALVALLTTAFGAAGLGSTLTGVGEKFFGGGEGGS